MCTRPWFQDHGREEERVIQTRAKVLNTRFLRDLLTADKHTRKNIHIHQGNTNQDMPWCPLRWIEQKTHSISKTWRDRVLTCCWQECVTFRGFGKQPKTYQCLPVLFLGDQNICRFIATFMKMETNGHCWSVGETWDHGRIDSKVSASLESFYSLCKMVL